MATHRLIILACAALPFLYTTAAAQNAGRYRNWDRNNDGVITRSEWQGTVREFQNLDWNGDGVLSDRELGTDDLGLGSFASIDRNRDGYITRGEWTGDRASFRRMDRNGDNFITRGEFTNADAGVDDYDRNDFNRLDYDNSGRIERDEWNGTVATFNRLDSNRDGVITQREFRAIDVSPAGRDDDFDVLDFNNNGVVSRDEWRSNLGRFNQYDVNRDGVVSRAEYDRAGTGQAVTRQVIRMDAQQQWTDTGIYVTPGDVVTYRALGTIQMSTGGDDRATPNGALSGRNASNAPRPDQKAGMLLFRIGNSGVGTLGENGSFVAQNGGELILGINDDHFQDNSGEYRVQLSVQPR